MARVPTYDNFQAGSTANPSTAFNTAIAAEAAAIPGRQQERMGQALQSAGQDVAQIVIDAQNSANQTMVLDGLNQAKQTINNLTFDPQNGLVTQTGKAVLNRDSGKPLADEYTDQLKDHVGQISASLGNDAQRRIFQEHVQPLVGQFYSNAMNHEVSQGRIWQKSVYEDTVKNGFLEISQDPLNSDTVKTALANIRGASTSLDQLTGTQNTAQTKEGVSKALAGGALKLLSDNNVKAAEDFLKTYAADLQPNELIRVQDVIRSQGNSMAGKFAATQTMLEYKDAFMPTPTDKLINLVGGAESSNQHYEKDGVTLKIHPEIRLKDGTIDTARGEFGIRPSTGKNPGFGVQPLQNDSREEHKRFTTDYLGSMLKENQGDLGKALASYQAGIGNVKDAVKAAADAKDGSTWLSHMPKATQSYVNTIMTKYAAGEGKPAMPTLAEAQQKAMDLAGDDPERKLIAKEDVTAKYIQTQYVMKQNDAMNLGKIYQALEQNGGSLDKVDLNLKLTIPPEKMASVKEFADRIVKGEDKTDYIKYGSLLWDPSGMKHLSQADMLALRPNMSKSDFNFAMNQWTKYQTGTAASKLDDVNDAVLKPLLDNRISSVLPGWRKFFSSKGDFENDTDAARVGAIKQYINSSIVRQQYEAGRQLTPEEMRKSLDQMFSQDLTFRNIYSWRSDSGVYKEKMFGMKASDIPDDTLAAIKSDFDNRGIKPTEQDLLGTYWRIKGAEKLATDARPIISYNNPKTPGSR